MCVTMPDIHGVTGSVSNSVCDVLADFSIIGLPCLDHVVRCIYIVMLSGVYLYIVVLSGVCPNQ